MNLSLGQAAKECGKSKATLSKALKSGKLSYISKTSAGYEIDPAELFRVFPKQKETPFKRTTVNDQKPPIETDTLTDLAVRLGISEGEKLALQKQIDQLTATLEDLKSDRDEWRDQAKVSQKLLEDHTAKKGGWWPFKRSA